MSVALLVTRGGRPYGATLVDEDIATKIAGRDITAHCGYPFVGRTALHRLVLGCTRNDGKVVHHLNEDKRDNRRQNLAVCDGLKGHGAMPHPKMVAAVREAGRAWRERQRALRSVQ